ncbi:MAG TPA: hypothetical protein VMT66_12165 [Steroidobacteraceae bacterium]|nr:hypothetical protein [Steroidobacteraceae bacterium]
MQAVETQKLILYHTDLRGQWPEEAANALAARLPYARRLALRRLALPRLRGAHRPSLAGIALAVRALGELLRRRISAGEIRFGLGEKPRLVRTAAPLAAEATVDFSISHSGPWVACAALAGGSVGLDLEMGTDERIADWVALEATLKASGHGLRAVREFRERVLRRGAASAHGTAWRMLRLDGFAGASACVVCDRDVAAIETRHVALAELFD